MTPTLPHHVAVSLAPPDTDAGLAALHALKGRVALAEVRLDLMDTFDLARLAAQAPCPLVVTCRPPREGGRFAGSEAERLDVLREAVRLGVAWVDVEWDSLAAFPRTGRGTRVLASRHALRAMPASWLAEYETLRAQADAVKLVGLAQGVLDVLPVLELLHQAVGPVVAIAMGAAGRATRLLAPAYASCLLTYGAASPGDATAPGQLAVSALIDAFALDRVGPHTQVHAHLAAGQAEAAAVEGANAGSHGAWLHVALVVTPGEARALADGLARHVPRLTLTADAELDLPLPPWSADAAATNERRHRDTENTENGDGCRGGFHIHPADCAGAVVVDDGAGGGARIERLSLSAAGESTQVVLGAGLLARLPELLARWRGARVCVVSDDVVGPLHAERVIAALTAGGFAVHAVRVPGGEAAKTLDVLARLYAECQAARLERRDVVVALGGGAVGDVAGMLAGTYLRGLDLVQVPTTLVALVTASVGGKVGVNFGGAKNLVGLFKQPALVVGDLDTLRTLPEAEFRSGLGELVTVGVLGAPALYDALEARAARAALGPDDDAELLPLVAEAVRCKAALVAADPFDTRGVRARLNLGHTFGHAFEALSGFTLPHGLAVAVGLHTAARLSALAGLCAPELPARLCRTLRALELPVTLEGYHVGDVLTALRGDKKRSGGRLRFVLPRGVGDVAVVSEDDLPAGALQAALERTLAGAAAEEEA